MRSRGNFGESAGGVMKVVVSLFLVANFCFRSLFFCFLEDGEEKSSEAKETPCSHCFVSR